jgi:hypothetical protein
MLAEASRGQHWSVHLSNKSDVDQDTARYIIIRCRRAFLLSQLEGIIPLSQDGCYRKIIRPSRIYIATIKTLMNCIES